jgi:hypothetical protein
MRKIGAVTGFFEREILSNDSVLFFSEWQLNLSIKKEKWFETLKFDSLKPFSCYVKTRYL